MDKFDKVITVADSLATMISIILQAVRSKDDEKVDEILKDDAETHIRRIIAEAEADEEFS